MKKIALLSFVALIAQSLAAIPYPTESPDPPEYSWHSVIMVDYSPGQEAEARNIIHKFEKAAETSGTPSPDQKWMSQGKYDVILIWELDHPQDQDRNWTPESSLWWQALIGQEGSEAAALKVHSEYQGLIDSAVSHISRKAN